jgi:hypothetical protein
MRRVYRGALPLEARLALHKRQAESANYAEAIKLWTKYRKSKAAKPLVLELQRMAGPRDRCYFCSDSRGVDVEHFEPIQLDYSRAFQWTNLLWACTGCNRKKGVRPVVVAGLEQLLNPTVREPWHHFIFDGGTGLLAPRYVDALPDRLATTTLAILDVLQNESVATGRQQSARRLRTGVEAAAVGDRRALRHAIDEDDYGLARWYSAFEGRDEEPFRTVRVNEPALWRYFVRASA